MMGALTKEWGDPPIYWNCVLSNLNTIIIIDRYYQRRDKKGNVGIMHVGNNILATAAEAVINENWFLLDNQSICNTSINGKYLSNIRDAPNGQYLHGHCSKGVTHTKTIGDPPR